MCNDFYRKISFHRVLLACRPNCQYGLFLVTRTRLVKVGKKYKGTGKFDIPYLMSDSMFWIGQQMYYSVRSSPGQALAIIQESILTKKNSLGVVLTCKTQQAYASLEFLQQLSKASREHVYRKATENWGIFQVSVILIPCLMKSAILVSLQWKGSYVILRYIQWDLIFPCWQYFLLFIHIFCLLQAYVMCNFMWE